MKKGNVLGIISAVTLSATLLTGCVDSMPDMTVEQSELIAEYSAGLILKYSPKYDYKVLNEEQIAYAVELALESGTEAETESAGETQTEAPPETEQEPAQDQTEQGASETVAAEESQPVDVVMESDADLAAELGIDDVIFRYQSFEVCNSYPKNNAGFSVSAAKGKKLLVVHFDLEGSAGEDVNFSMFEYDLGASMTINETSSAPQLSTLVPNDLSSFVDVIPAGKTVDAVLLVEIGDMTEEEIQSLTMRMTSKGQSCTVKLK